MSKCVMCGYDPDRATSQDQISHNKFINEKDSKDVCIINSNKDFIVDSKGVKYVREGVVQKQTIAAGTPAIVPVTKTPITVTGSVPPSTPTK